MNPDSPFFAGDETTGEGLVLQLADSGCSVYAARSHKYKIRLLSQHPTKVNKPLLGTSLSFHIL